MYFYLKYGANALRSFTCPQGHMCFKKITPLENLLHNCPTYVMAMRPFATIFIVATLINYVYSFDFRRYHIESDAGATLV